jgi:hypothetical protein
VPVEIGPAELAAAISVLINLPIFFQSLRQAAASEYAADIALTCIAFPSITTGIVVAMDSASARLGRISSSSLARDPPDDRAPFSEVCHSQFASN